MFRALALAASFVLVLLLGGHALGLFDSDRPVDESASARASAQTAHERLADRGRWVREVSAICRRADAWYDRQPDPETQRELVRWLARAVPKNRAVNAEIVAVRPPEGAERDLRDLRRLFATDERLLVELLAAARARNWPAYRATLAAARRVYRKEDRIHRRWGAIPCTSAYGAAH